MHTARTPSLPLFVVRRTPHHMCTGLLDASAAFATEAPFPRVWVQGSAVEPATDSPTPMPAAHAAWFDASEWRGTVPHMPP